MRQVSDVRSIPKTRNFVPCIAAQLIACVAFTVAMARGITGLLMLSWHDVQRKVVVAALRDMVWDIHCDHSIESAHDRHDNSSYSAMLKLLPR